MSNDTTLWTIQDLGNEVKRALLAAEYAGSSNGQIRAVPNQRTIRYYTTLGILDRPATFRGRTALYNRRHLLQIVAIKRLQEKGLSLVEVQQRLAGITQVKLRTLASIDGDIVDANAVTPRPSPRRAKSFWMDASPPAALSDDVDDADDTAMSKKSAAQPQLRGVTVGTDLTILVQAARTLTDDDEEAIREASQRLLVVLIERGITTDCAAEDQVQKLGPPKIESAED